MAFFLLLELIMYFTCQRKIIIIIVCIYNYTPVVVLIVRRYLLVGVWRRIHLHRSRLWQWGLG